MNLSIPDAAVELAVSESRLRRTLLEIAIPTSIEFRHTRTGVRKTAVLDETAMNLMRCHYATSAHTEQTHGEATTNADPCPVSESIETSDDLQDAVYEEITPESAPSFAVAPSQSVPIAQFNALLYQHNVLRQELSRVTDYLDGCDRLLGEMVRTIATLEERTQRFDPVRAPERIANPLAGALRSVTAGFHNTLFAKMTAKPAAQAADVFYGGALAGQ